MEKASHLYNVSKQEGSELLTVSVNMATVAAMSEEEERDADYTPRRCKRPRPSITTGGRVHGAKSLLWMMKLSRRE